MRNRIYLFVFLSLYVSACLSLSLCLHSTVWQCDQIGRFFEPVATIILPKSPTLLCNFCKISHFPGEIIFGQLLWKFGDFYLVTLAVWPNFAKR